MLARSHYGREEIELAMAPFSSLLVIFPSCRIM
jgi:hypothetical protein